MSDLEDSTITYTKVSSLFEDLSNLGYPGVDGLPMMSEEPYAYVEATLQEPPSPEFVLEPEDEKDPEEDLEEDPTDYPADRGDDDDYDDESSDDDKEDANDVDEDEDEEEEEHLALVDSVPSPVYRTTTTISIRPQTLAPFLFEAERITDFATTVRQDTDEIYRRLDDTQDDRSLMSGQLNLLRRDRRTHARTTRPIKSEAKLSLEAWTKIGDLRAADCRQQTQLTEALTLLKTLQTQMVALQSQQTPARDPSHPDVPEEADSSS
ncbi:hypothetical protein Tco_0853818 [Tanacetum coccineum]